MHRECHPARSLPPGEESPPRPPAPLVVTGCQLRACVSGGTELQSAPLHLNSDFTNIAQRSPCLPMHYLIECSGQPGNVGIAVLVGHRGESGGQKDYVITISGSRHPHLGLAPPHSSSKAPQNRARVQLAPQLQPSAQAHWPRFSQRGRQRRLPHGLRWRTAVL